MRIVAAVALLVISLLPSSIAGRQNDAGPAPGRLIDIGGRRLHLHCSGSGAPTVILEAGASSFAIDWALVQPDVAERQRVCSYDRTGSGWSDAAVLVETPARVVADLHALLTAAGERPPYVLVGASMGGLYVRLYQLDHPADVAGLVLVDPVTEDRLFTQVEGKTVTIASLTADQLRPTLPSGPVNIPVRKPQTGSPFDRLPPDRYAQRIALDERLIASFPPSVSAAIVHESAEGRRAALARLLASRDQDSTPLRRSPLVVLTRGQNPTPGLAEDHATLARLSSQGQHRVVTEAGHEIHLYAPAVVVQAIRDVSSSLRARQ